MLCIFVVSSSTSSSGRFSWSCGLTTPVSKATGSLDNDSIFYQQQYELVDPSQTLPDNFWFRSGDKRNPAAKSEGNRGNCWTPTWNSDSIEFRLDFCTFFFLFFSLTLHQACRLTGVVSKERILAFTAGRSPGSFSAWWGTLIQFQCAPIIILIRSPHHREQWSIRRPLIVC